MSKINGYLVVERAESHLYDSYKTDNFPLVVDGLYYKGFGRIAEFDENELPLASKDIYLKADNNQTKSLTYPLVESYDNAMVLSNERKDCEVIGIRSNKLGDYFSQDIECEMPFKGIDIYCSGFLIKEEMFARKILTGSTPFSDFYQSLNENGLFESENDVMEFLNFYEKIQPDEKLEKIWLEEAEITEVYGQP